MHAVHKEERRKMAAVTHMFLDHKRRIKVCGSSRGVGGMASVGEMRGVGGRPSCCSLLDVALPTRREG
jgi:hypothetical protein